MTDPPPGFEHPGWARWLARARRSLERSGGSLDGAISLSAPTDEERLVAIGATGTYRSADAGRLTVRLRELDQYLREAFGAGLVATVAAQAPLRNRPAEASSEAAARDTVTALLRSSVHSGTDWFGQWLEGMHRDGTLTRVVRGGTDISAVVAVLDALPAPDEPMPVFADRVLHDTKALADSGLRGLLVRALVAWQGVTPPANQEEERALWESVGVVPDDLASQVLVLNLPARGGLLGEWLTGAARYGIPMRITLYQLRSAPLTVDSEVVYVCENPAVLRAAAGRCTRPLVCSEGVPSAAVHALLRCAPRATIWWRNDFDWTGVRLTAAALRRYPTARPWRMTTAEYRRASGTGPALIGVPAATQWEPELAEAMRASGRAVMEERLIDVLLADLES